MAEQAQASGVFAPDLVHPATDQYRRAGRTPAALLDLVDDLAALQARLHGELSTGPQQDDQSSAPPADWTSRAVRETVDVFVAHSPQSAEGLRDIAAAAAKLETTLLAAAARGDDPALSQVAGMAGLPLTVTLFVLRSALQPYLAWQSGAAPMSAADQAFPLRQCCPACGGRPLMGKHVEPDGHRFLRCALCGHEWAFPRLACPGCGEQEQAKLESLFVPGDEGHRAYVCMTCKRYTKVSDERLLGGRVYLPLEDIVTLHLDDMARERGYIPVSE